MWAFRIYHTFLNPPVQYNICKNLHELYHLLLQVYNLPFPTYVVLDLFPLMQRPSSFTLIAAEHSAGWMHHSWYWIFLLVKKKMGCVDDVYFGDEGLVCPHGQETLDWTWGKAHMTCRWPGWSSGLYLPNTPRCHRVVEPVYRCQELPGSWHSKRVRDTSSPPAFSHCLVPVQVLCFPFSSLCPFTAWNQCCFIK